MVADGKGGSIVNLASIASLIGVKDRFAYHMSKGAVLTMTYSLATDFVKQNVRCNCVCPARVHTPFVDGFLEKSFPAGQVSAYIFMAHVVMASRSHFRQGRYRPI